MVSDHLMISERCRFVAFGDVVVVERALRPDAVRTCLGAAAFSRRHHQLALLTERGGHRGWCGRGDAHDGKNRPLPGFVVYAWPVGVVTMTVPSAS